MVSIKTGKWFRPLAALLFLVLAVLAWERLAPTARVELSPDAGRSQNPVYLGALNSIAVLPFGSESSEPQAAFWARGFSMELHGLMTRVPGLAVTSRNSSFFFSDPELPLSTAAERLQVTRLITGEVGVAGERIRISVSLYDARKRRETWSESYEGGLPEVFGILDRIIESVADVARLPATAPLPRARPVDVHAWEWLLRGSHAREQRTVDAYHEAESAFRSALEIDPRYDEARIALAGTLLARNATGQNDPVVTEEARTLLNSALSRRPGSAEALGLLSYLRRSHDWDWWGALEAAEEAVRRSPGDPEVMGIASLANFSLGRFGEARELLETAVRQDPLNLLRRFRLGLLEEFSGDYESALSSYRQVIGLNPDFPGARAFRARVKILQEKPDSAMRESEQEPDAFWRQYAETLSLAAQDNRDEARERLDRLIREHGQHAAYQIAEIQAFMNEADLAFEWLERAVEQRDGGMGELVGNRFLDRLREDSRWPELLRRLSLPLDLAD